MENNSPSIICLITKIFCAFNFYHVTPSMKNMLMENFSNYSSHVLFVWVAPTSVYTFLYCMVSQYLLRSQQYWCQRHIILFLQVLYNYKMNIDLTLSSSCDGGCISLCSVINSVR